MISSTPSAASATATEANSSSPATATAAATARYPKRKRAEVNYRLLEDESDTSGYTSTDSGDSERLPAKRPRIPQPRPTKPLPRRKIFPFLLLPAELRNRIYRLCLPAPAAVPPDVAESDDAQPGIFLAYKLKRYRRTLEYIPSYVRDVEEHCHYGYQYHTDKNNHDEERPPHLAFHVLGVCKQIHDEAAPMFYGQRLIFTDPDALFSFAACLSPRTAKLLRHIEIRSWGMSRSRKSRGYMAMAMLAAKGVTELETLYINCNMGYFRINPWNNRNLVIPIPTRIARKVYRDCHLWLEAVGAANADPFRAVGILKISMGMFAHMARESSDDLNGFEEQAMKAYRKELRRLLGGIPN
ncbi:uncharacterized protein EI97DRAFT_4288 [Westerdykella ornata]|uniref:Uncharacterized protein n=1 Tax=Westerdykella ornata TaxID=318751 RepID=A0A6A6JVL9_WESOR|nr:uncharacterized protein EI97DRAFT_4288 [Westerdykella ornata]KAF2280650.1 hypothetical protein EI97DRAFT_4288 [Westerdykella ornata]